METVSAEQLAEWGYEAPAKSGGRYLRLEKRGDSARVRLVSKPLKFTETITSDDGTEKQVTRWGFVVLHKELIDNKVIKSVKVFKAGAMVYGGIFDYASHPDWGNPMHYDFTISRTEEKGKYYTVVAHPKPMGAITDEELAMVMEAGLSLEEMFLGEAQAAPVSDDPYAE